MNFDNDKKQALAKLDKSKKGCVDKEIKSLVELINDCPDFYTTSSCSGRIMLTTLGTKKFEFTWLFVSHDKVNCEDIIQNLIEVPDKTVWLRMEQPIIHICARNLEVASELMKLANESGFRRSSLLSIDKRIVIEIMIPEKMDVPISSFGKILVSDNYIRFIVKEVNIKLEQAHKKIKKLKKLFFNKYYNQN